MSAEKLGIFQKSRKIYSKSNPLAGWRLVKDTKTQKARGIEIFARLLKETIKSNEHWEKWRFFKRDEIVFKTNISAGQFSDWRFVDKQF